MALIGRHLFYQVVVYCEIGETLVSGENRNSYYQFYSGTFCTKCSYGT
jgi:hypothetical protein